MLKFIKKAITQKIINNFYHLPEAMVANLIYGFPSRKLKVIGVTGTDGKTTTTNMIYQIFKEAGKKVSMVSTINAVVGNKTFETGFHVTSPGRFAIQKLLKQAQDQGSEYVILEVTSHALDQYRFWGIKFDVGVITNITHEHLDYHKTFENYKNTKLKLIRNVDFAIVNQNIDKLSYTRNIRTFGLNSGDFNQRKLHLKLKIPGTYNIENALAAMSVASVLGIKENKARATLEKFEGLEGRMEEVKNNKGIKIVIDFAHTPNGLEQALVALRSQFKKGRLIAVFGAASERDVLKRPIMGKISAQHADITILTSEDPRFEDSNKIIKEIAAGFLSTSADRKNLYKEADRAKAIQLAISLSKKGDIIGIFGKGHEKSMNYQGVEKPWSDKEAVKAALN